MAPFAVCKQWLSPQVERQVWYFASVHPTAEAMKEVTIESRPTRKWVHTFMRAKDGTTILGAAGRNLVNPCVQCDMYDEIGVGAFCGRCRSRPVVQIMPFAVLGGHRSQCRSPSPRRGYFDMIQRQTCPNCGTLFRDDPEMEHFIQEKDACVTCRRQLVRTVLEGWPWAEYEAWRASVRGF